MLIVFWIFCIIATASVADAKGLNGCGYLILSIIIGPIALLIVAVMPTNHDELTRLSLKSGKLRRCPRCAEAIQRQAEVCRFCGFEIPEVMRVTTAWEDFCNWLFRI
jgi:hypothetical protein